jgi:WD40 repeat protein
MVRLWRLSDGVCIKVLKHKSTVTWVAFDKCANTLVSASDDGELVVWDTRSLLLSEGSATTGSNYCDFLNESLGHTGVIWKVNPFDNFQHVVGSQGECHCLVLPHFSDSRDFQLLSSAHTNGQSSLPTGIEIKSMCVHPSGQVVVTGCSDGVGRLWQVGPEHGLVQKRSLRTSSGSLSVDGVTSNGAHSSSSGFASSLASPAYSFALERINQRLLLRLEGHLHPITDICFNVAGDRLLTGSILDGTVRIWSFSGNFSRCEQIILSVVDRDDKQFLDQQQAVNSSLSKLHSRRASRKKGSSSIELSGVAWCCDDRSVVTLQSLAVTDKAVTSNDEDDKSGVQAYMHCKLKLWSAFTGQLLHVLEFNEMNMWQAIDAQILVTHPVDSSIVLTAGKDGLITVWDTANMQCLHQHRLTQKSLQHADARNIQATVLDLTDDDADLAHLLDATFSEDGKHIMATDMLGRVSVLGFSNPEKYFRVPVEQYFSTDYAEVVHDEFGFAIDLNTQLPVSECPKGLLCHENGTPYDDQPYHKTVRYSADEGDNDTNGNSFTIFKQPTGPAQFQLGDSEISSLAENAGHWQEVLLNGSYAKQLDQAYDNMCRSKTRQVPSGDSGKPSTDFGRLRNVGKRLLRPSNIHSFHSDEHSDDAHFSGFHRFGGNHHSNGTGGSTSRQNPNGSSSSGRGAYYCRSNGSGAEEEDALPDPAGHSRWAVFSQDVSEAQKRDRERRRLKRNQRRAGGDDDDDYEDYQDSDDSFGEVQEGTRRSARQQAGPRLKRERRRNESRPTRGVMSEDEDHDESEGSHRHKRSRLVGAASSSGSHGVRSGSKRTAHKQGDEDAEPRDNGKLVLRISKQHVSQAVPSWANIDRSWLQSAHTIDCQYVPQAGDSIVYIPHGHREYLQQYPNKAAPPWLSFPVQWHAVRCVVVDVQYSMPVVSRARDANHSVVVSLTCCLTHIPLAQSLRSSATSSSSSSSSGLGSCPYQCTFVEPRVSRHSSSSFSASGSSITFQIQLRNCELPDFLIPWHLFARTVQTPFYNGMPVKAMYKQEFGETDDIEKILAELKSTSGSRIDEDEAYEDGFIVREYSGTVIGIDLSSGTAWDSLVVRWDRSGDTGGGIGMDDGDRINPWEATPDLARSDASKALRSMKGDCAAPALSTQLVTRFLAQIDAIMNSDPDKFQCFEYPVDPSVFPDYYSLIPVYTCVDLIRRRLKKSFYRQEAALRYDIRLIASNCARYNEPEATIVSWAQELCDLLEGALNTIQQDSSNDNDDAAGVFASQSQDSTAISMEELHNNDNDNDFHDEDAMAEAEPAAVEASPAARRSTRSASRIEQFNARNTSVTPVNMAESVQQESSVQRRAASNRSANTAHAAHATHATHGGNVCAASTGDSDPSPRGGGESLSQLTQGPGHPRRLDPDLKAAMLSLVNYVDSIDDAGLFKDPVTEDIAPCYFEIVSQPMDTSTIRSKIAKRQYSSVAEVMEDIVLILKNCELYNDPTSDIVSICRRTRKLIRGQYPELYNQISPAGDESDNERGARNTRSRAPKTTNGRQSTSSDKKRGRDSSDDESSDDDDSSESAEDSSGSEATDGEVEQTKRRRGAGGRTSSTSRNRSYDDAEEPSSRRPVRKSRTTVNYSEPSSPPSSRNAKNAKNERGRELEVTGNAARSSRRMDPDLRAKMVFVIDSFDALDEDGYFTDPVTEDLAPGYFDVIDNPMDSTTIRCAHEYVVCDVCGGC